MAAPYFGSAGALRAAIVRSAQAWMKKGPRRATVPMTAMNPIHFDLALPISQKRDEIARTVAAHPVVIVCGETGSGKTTSLAVWVFGPGVVGVGGFLVFILWAGLDSNQRPRDYELKRIS